MSEKLGVVDLNSGISVADLGESKEGLGGGMVEGPESKTLVENSGDKVGLGDGVRVLEESEFLDGASINGSGRKVFESGSLEISNLYGASKNRVAEMKSRKNGWESWGVMDLVGRVLGGKLHMDNETEDVNISVNRPDVNMVPDMNAWQGIIGESAPKNGIDIKETVIDRDSDKLNLDLQTEGNILNVNQDLASLEMVPDGKMEIEEIDESKDYVLTPLEHGDCITDREGEYHVSDLVWGKVRSHPWWPGQIFEPSAASDKAEKYRKRNSYLIAYFGDQTFAWNDGSKIKPFQVHLSEMEKQSNADGFCRAVQCALDEFSRRVELSLSCQCLPQEVHDMVKFQVVANDGIRDEFRRRAGGGDLSSATSFLPGEVMQFLESLAQFPKHKTDSLQLTMSKAQLLAFSRWKGRYHLPIYEECGRFLEDASQFTEKGKMKAKESLQGPGLDGNNYFPSKKRESTARGSHRKRKCRSGDEENPRVKEKCLSVLMSSSRSSIQDDKKAPRREIILSDIPPTDVIFSELSFAAKDPKQWLGARTLLVNFLSEFRNTICLEKSIPGCTTPDALKWKGEKPPNSGIADIFGVDGTEDSYWTDRIIQNYSEDQVLLVPQIASQRAAEVEANTGTVLSLDNSKDREIVFVDLDAEDSSAPTSEVSEEHFPTALILNFTSLESIPPISNLNEIFRRYGPLKESETEILTKSKRAKVIFKRREDAETAFSSTGKYSIFGPSLVSYRLNYAPTPQKSSAKSKRSKMDSSLKPNV